MPAAPQVRELQSLIAEQQKSLNPQYDLINNDIATNATAGAAQEKGLAAKEETAFGNITQDANDKGMFFSGFSPDEKAKYTAGTYLPALAQLQATIAQTRSQLLGKKAELGKSAFDAATNIREKDVDRLNQWNSAEVQRQWETHQAEVQRAFTADQNAKDRAAAERASQRAAAASGSSKPSAGEVLTADRNSIASQLASATGDDGYVSPGTYKALKNAWVGKGYDAGTYDAYFAPFKNPQNPYYK